MSRLLVTNKSFELLEPYEGKLSRTVLRGESSRKGADLLDILEMGFENGHEWYATWRMGVDQLLETNRAVAEKMATAADPELYKANLPYKRIYPIPSSEINANKLMEQNPGNN